MTQDVKVWDLPLRLFHWSLVVLVALAFATGDLGPKWMETVHIWIGYAVAGLLGFRLIWGFAGTRYSRFSSFFYRPGEILSYLKDLVRLKHRHYLGHNPAGAAMIYALLATLALLVGSGLAAISDIRFAEAAEELHEGMSGFLLVLVAAHVGGVAIESLLSGTNLVRSMIDGRKAAAIGLALAFAFLSAFSATAQSPRDAVLQEYAKAAGEPVSAERGRLFYGAQQTGGKPETPSCASCHGASPKGPGQNVKTGKPIEPMAVSANPKRFVDAEETEKWFGRNCKEVLGRACAAREKADFLAYLAAQ